MNGGSTQVTPTMCPMNCHPTQCGMLADVRDGKLLGVRGDKDNPDSQGFLCVRGQVASEIIGNPKRLLTPLIVLKAPPTKSAGLLGPSPSSSKT